MYKIKSILLVVVVWTAVSLLLASCDSGETSAGSTNVSRETLAETVTTTTTEAEIVETTTKATVSEETTAETTTEATPAVEATAVETTAEETTAETTEATTSVETTTAETTTAATEAAPAESTITEVSEMNTEKKLIALTFDDGPNASTTLQVLDKLEKHGIVASFFLIGDNINALTARSVKKAFEMGCEIDNHSKTHTAMTSQTDEEILAELKFTSDKVEEITGQPTKFFRPPYIAADDRMLNLIEMPFIAGYGCEDWMDTVTAEQRAEKILSQIKDGGIILMHDAQGNDKTVEALDILIPALKEQGYEFVTVSELFEQKGITPDEFIYTNVLQKNKWYN